MDRIRAPKARRLGLVCTAAIAGWGSIPGFAGEPPAPTAGVLLTRDLIQSFAGDKAVTRPSRDATMGFSLPTRVTEVAVKGGQDVKKGDLLVRGDEHEDSLVVKLQEIRATTDLPVQKVKRAAALAKLEYEKLLDAGKVAGSVSPQELDRAKLTWESQEIDVGTAEIQQQQEVIQVDRLRARVDRLQIRAPFDGQVDVVLADTGQSVSDNDKVVRVVRIDPLWIDVYPPTGKTYELGLKNDDPAWVLLDLPGDPVVRAGKIVEVAPTADASSGTRRVRVELPNPERLVAGVTCYVRFAEPAGEWKDRVAPGRQAEASR